MTGNLWLSTGLDPIHLNSGEALFGLSLEATSPEQGYYFLQ